MTEQERDQILLKLLEIVSGHEEKLSSIQEIVSGHEEKLSSIQEIVSGHEEKLSAIQENVSSLQEIFSDLEKEVRSISKSVAKIEVEHGNKIQLLADGQVSILEKLNSFEKRFESDEKELVNHSNRIWNLEDHIGIA